MYFLDSSVYRYITWIIKGNKNELISQIKAYSKAKIIREELNIIFMHILQCLTGKKPNILTRDITDSRMFYAIGDGQIVFLIGIC